MPARKLPILLFDDECAICRRLAHWVYLRAHHESGAVTLIIRGIGEDPGALQALHAELDIWEAYKTVHVLMPDGTLKRGGEAVAEVLRCLPGCSWLGSSLTLSIAGHRPMQSVLDLAYGVLSDLRPFLGCESCGTPSAWVGPLVWLRKLFWHGPSARRLSSYAPNFTSPVPGKPRARRSAQG